MVSRFTWGLLAVVVVWLAIVEWRRVRERLRDDSAGVRARELDEHTVLPDDDEPIDWATLEEAEREVRDLDPRQRPKNGFEGDDWGPGTRPPPAA